MKSAVKNYFIIGLAFLLGACGGYLPAEKNHWPLNQEERHAWYPPDERTLSARRANQLQLDALTEEIEILFVNHATFSDRELALFESMNQIDPEINTMDSKYSQQLETEQARKARMEKDIETSKAGFMDAEIRLKKLMAVKPPIMFSVSDYNSAMKSFRDGQFKKSLRLLFKIKSKNPPLFLQDNIQFALGSIYYRTKNYLKAKQHFQKILDSYPQGDKRFVSYFMLGVIHNLQGEKSRALFLLEEALGKNPPKRLQIMFHRLINIVNDESSYAAG